MELCWQSNVSAFYYAVYVCHSFSSKEEVSFNFMAAVTICNDFGAQEDKVTHYFHCFSIYLPWCDGTDAMILVFWCWVLIQIVSCPLSCSSRGSSVLFCLLPFGLCHLHIWSWYWYWEIDISPSNLDSSLCFIQPGISQDVLCMQIK